VTVLWLIFGAVVLVLLALDLGVFHRKNREVSTREALIWTGVWITVGLSFSVAIYFVYENNWFGATIPDDPEHVLSDGARAMLMYLTGYVLEKSLSIDNIFVIAMVFEAFNIEQRYQHRVLYWGILGAIVMRAGMVIGGAWLLTRFTWLFYPFGAYLVFTGVRMLFHKKDDKAPHDRRLVTWVRHWIPVAEGDHHGHFLVRRDGHRMLSILFLVLVVVELTDVVFAVDSVPAILAITTDPFLVLTSNIFAILGLRSLYFVLANMMARFKYLSYSLALILVLIGSKMVLHHVWKVPTLLSLGGILALLPCPTARREPLVNSVRNRNRGVPHGLCRSLRARNPSERRQHGHRRRTRDRAGVAPRDPRDLHTADLWPRSLLNVCVHTNGQQPPGRVHHAVHTRRWGRDRIQLLRLGRAVVDGARDGGVLVRFLRGRTVLAQRTDWRHTRVDDHHHGRHFIDLPMGHLDLGFRGSHSDIATSGHRHVRRS